MNNPQGILIVVLLLIISHPLFSQISQGGRPASFDIKGDTQVVKTVSLQSPDMESVNEEDLRNDSLSLPRRFAVLIPVKLDLLQSGTFIQLEDGSQIFRLKIQATGALANNLYFDDFFLPEGVKLFLYDDSKKQLKGAFTSFNNPKSGYFAVELMAGETIILELNIPSGIKTKPVVHIAEFGFAYRDVPHYNDIDGFTGSDWCEVNVNCSPEGDDWQVQKRAVVKIVVKVFRGSYMCTGALVNNVRNDATPYVLTADHCAFQEFHYATDTDLDQWVFYFNYESATCDPGTTPVELSMVGASKVSQGGNRGQDGSDFYLVLLKNQIPESYNPFFLGWSRIDEVSEQGVTIHHPEGDVKKISTYLTPTESSSWFGNGLQSHWKVYWAETENNWGVTEGGSSGSPLFNNNGLLIGTLTGGLAACDESGSLGPDKPDYYGKFSYHWQSNGTTDTAQLKPWLDPDNTGVLSLGGYLDINENMIVNNLDINIYPNPTNEYFFINFTSLESKKYLISIYDVIGKLIKEINCQHQQSEIKINIEDIPPGVYFLTVKADNRSIIKKLIIQ